MTVGPMNKNVTQILKLLDHVEEVVRRFDVDTLAPLPTGDLRDMIANDDWEGALEEAVTGLASFEMRMAEEIGKLAAQGVPVPQQRPGVGLLVITGETAAGTAVAGLMRAVTGLLFYEILRGTGRVPAGYAEGD